MTTLAIIGTAGRGDLHKLMDRGTHEKMMRAAVKLGDEIWRPTEEEPRLQLVSGGAAWADHVAVGVFKLFPDAYNLTICGPCPWDRTNKRFQDTGERNSRTNPGGTANYYHSLYKQRTQIESLEWIDQCFDYLAGFEYIHGLGFNARNKMIVNRASHLLAFTFGDGDTPAAGGTLHTWNLAKAKGIPCQHISIPTM